MKLVTVFEYDDLVKLQSAVVVEMWDRVMSTGSGKRKFNAEFNESERELIKQYYKIFYTWHFGRIGGTGVPKEHRMTISTYKLMHRACHFFSKG